MNQQFKTLFLSVAIFIFTATITLSETLPNSMLLFAREGKKHFIIKIEGNKYYYSSFEATNSNFKENIAKLVIKLEKEEGVSFSEAENLIEQSKITTFAHKHLKLNQSVGYLLDGKEGFQNKSLSLRIEYNNQDYYLDGWNNELFEIIKLLQKKILKKMNPDGVSP